MTDGARRTLLVVDDEPDVHHSFRRILCGRGIELLEARSAEDALVVLKQVQPLAALVDVQLPGMSGLELLRRLTVEQPHIRVVIMTAYASSDVTISSMRDGAFDSIHKPFDVERALETIDRALAAGGQARPVEQPSLVTAESGAAIDLIGDSPAMQEVYKAIGQVADRDVAVLVTGESGTGKELVARAIHRHSRRAAHPFLAINCAAVPDTLLDSELFGHERGAFTGASERVLGRFERADSGTLFLDEVGELGLGAQAKLLRVLETGEIERVGGAGTVKLDVRLIAATNRDVTDEVAVGRFRKDLFYRLNVFRIHIPPLRERAGDVALLAESFVRRYARVFRKEIEGFAPGTEAVLGIQPWPGNVRELENTIKRAVILARTPRLSARDILEAHVPASSHEHAGRIEEHAMELLRGLAHAKTDPVILRAAERILIGCALRQSEGNVSRAARILGLDRSTLRKRIVRLTVPR